MQLLLPVLLLLCSCCSLFEDVVSEVAVALGRTGLSSVAVGGADDIVLGADSCLSGGLGLDPLTARRSSLVKLELRIETLPPSKRILPGWLTGSCACLRILVLVQLSWSFFARTNRSCWFLSLLMVEGWIRPASGGGELMNDAFVNERAKGLFALGVGC